VNHNNLKARGESLGFIQRSVFYLIGGTVAAVYINS
jgi:hypothetical protein